MQPNKHLAIPDLVNGYELDAAGAWFSVIIPEASTNLCINPSFETDTTGWSAGAGTLSRSSAYQQFGVYSARYQPSAAVNDGCYLGATAAALIPTTAGQWYTASFYFKGAGGSPYQIYFADQWGNRLGQAVTFFAAHDWSRVTVSWYETQTTSRRVYIAKNNSANIFPFYVDGVQVENKAYATTYFDGDSVGYVVGVTDFYWNGARHASTSYRTAQTGAGGKVVKLKDMGFVLLAIVGLGMAPMNPISQDYGWQDGALYQRTRKPARDFTLAGYIGGATLDEVKRYRAQLMAAFSPDNLSTQQPLTLLYEYSNKCGAGAGEVLTLPCLYRDGLPGNTDNLYGEKVGLNFTMFLPLISKQTEEGVSLGFTRTIIANYAAMRKNGLWQSIGSGAGFNAPVYSVLVDKNHGRIYFGGDFTTADGLTVNYFTYWDIALQTFVAVGGGTIGVNNGVSGLALTSNGDVWIVGALTTAGGAATKYVARYNYSTNTFTCFNLAATGGNWKSVAIDSTGKVYLAGEVYNWNGDAAQDYFTSYDGATWATPGISPFTADDHTTFRNTIAIDAYDNVYVGSTGSLGNTGGLRRLTGATWTLLGATNITAGVGAVSINPDGTVAAGGPYASLGGIALANIAIWNGKTFLPCGAGTNGSVSGLMHSAAGLLLAYGNFTEAGGFSVDYAAVWNGSAWYGLDIVFGTYLTAGIYSDNDLLLCPFLNISAEAAYLTTLTNTGSEPAFPIITITGPGAVYQIQNNTTGDILSFNLTLLAGEVATLDLTQNNISFTSNWRGNILSTILPGSNLAGFKLLPGANSISVFITGATAATAVDMHWQPQYLGLEH